MHDVLSFAVPAGYRISSAESATSVECNRGCGWRLRAATLSAMTDEARDTLFRFHDDWHTKPR
jgi:hypothetical protein